MKSFTSAALTKRFEHAFRLGLLPTGPSVRIDLRSALARARFPGEDLPADTSDDEVVLEDDLVDVEIPRIGLVRGGDVGVRGGEVGGVKAAQECRRGR